MKTVAQVKIVKSIGLRKVHRRFAPARMDTGSIAQTETHRLFGLVPSPIHDAALRSLEERFDQLIKGNPSNLQGCRNGKLGVAPVIVLLTEDPLYGKKESTLPF